MLLGHSYLWDPEMWRPQINALSQHYRIIVPALWGTEPAGRSPAGSRNLRDIAVHHPLVRRSSTQFNRFPFRSCRSCLSALSGWCLRDALRPYSSGGQVLTVSLPQLRFSILFLPCSQMPLRLTTDLRSPRDA